MKKYTLSTMLVLIVIFTLGVAAVSAQNGPGGRGGRGNGGNGANGGGNGQSTNTTTTNAHGGFGAGNNAATTDPVYGGGANSGQNANSGTNCTAINGLNCTGTNTGTGSNRANSAGATGSNGNGNGANGQNGVQSQSGLLLNLPAATNLPLTDDVIAAMTDGLMDEYNAMAIYTSVLGQFGDVAPFSNIIVSEQQHAAMWELMFERYGLELPAMPAATIGVFTSVSDACATAADAEIANFGIYDSMMDTFQDYPDLLYVATSLRNASEFSHLPAFERCAASYR